MNFVAKLKCSDNVLGCYFYGGVKFATELCGGAENAGVEDARVEKAGATKYGKPSEENTLKYETKCRGFHAYLLPNATHKRVGLLTLLLSSKQLGTSKQ